MQAPTEVAFQHCEPTEMVRAEIDRQTRRLERFGDRITGCHIVVAQKQARHRTGNLFQVGIRIAMPGHRDVIVGREHRKAPEHEHVLVAVRDAFDAVMRQIEDAARAERTEIKDQPQEEYGRVTKFLAGEDCGFIETPDGREIYFHRNAVVGGAFDRLTVGAQVHFVEALGERGLEASAVRLVGKHHLA